jgi:hypothetical protein
MKIRDILERGLIMPQTIKPMGLIHLPGKGPNNRFDFKNKGNNRVNEIGETKEAPAGTYFTKTGNLVKGTLTKAARAKGARETDPKDSQRSKVPPVTQSNEARGTCWHGYQQKGYKKKGNKMVPNCVKEEAAGVGIITKQNTTADVKPGETTRQANKLGLGLTKKGVPARSMREEWEEFLENFADGKRKGKSRPGRVKRAGASCKGSVTSLRAKAKKSSGERAKMYHWCANMKSGRKKK